MITWKKIEHEVGPVSQIGKVGKWLCFRIEWGSTRSEDGDYVLRCMLPGIKEFIRVKSNEHGKTRALEILEYWIKKSEIMNKEKRIGGV